ncbi:MAG: carbamoyltransferase [Betaproteobacteria bacterium]|nr:carbamoyltransferase [Betaproteobacteria bacterium]
MTYILGLNAYHGDSSACLVRDGTLVAAAEEERFRRIKHWAGFPSESIRYCLSEAGIGLADLERVAINQDAGANLWKKLAYMVMRRPDLSLVLDRIRNKRERMGVAEELARTFPGERLRAQVHEVEHHLAHLGSAFLVSPFKEAVAVSVDGFGDFASAAWGVGRGSRVAADEKVYFPHSLGIFYQALTQYLGFPNYGDEYKVMGLAPYGKPDSMAEMRQIVKLEDDGAFHLNLDYFRHHKEKIEYEWENGEPFVGDLYSPRLSDLLGPARHKDEPLIQRHKDIARSVQAMYEEAFFHLLNRLHERHRVDNLVIAGGCGMNSVANGKVYRHTPFKRLYVQSAAGDAGGAIGAAFVAWHEMAGTGGFPHPGPLPGGEGAIPGPHSDAKRAISDHRTPGGNPPGDMEARLPARFVMDHAYWGPSFSDEEISRLLEQHAQAITREQCSVRRIVDEDELARVTADAISRGLVTGWFQGRMEWGPRALGNRSILADPRRADMKDILNVKIKRRESFRPFAPSVLREHVAEWFEADDDVPFMMQVYPIRAEKQSLIPAVTHVDGSGRLQTVTRDTNPRYYALIEAFRVLTGVPMVLNTSFNENEPVVCKPREALDCFLRTKMDLLVMGEWMVERDPAR